MQVKVATPQALTDEQRHLFELLARLENGGNLSENGTESPGEDSPHQGGLFDRIKEFLSGG